MVYVTNFVFVTQKVNFFITVYMSVSFRMLPASVNLEVWLISESLHG